MNEGTANKFRLKTEKGEKSAKGSVALMPVTLLYAGLLL